MMKKVFISVILIFFILNIFSQDWKTYPYIPNKDSKVLFPLDEGRHEKEKMEWWYTTGHVVGQTTGKHYTYMLTYFYYPYGKIDGFRILNISDDDEKVFYDEAKFLNYTTMATDKLDIEAKIYKAHTETWKNKYKDNKIVPFEYKIKAKSDKVTLDLDYVTTKRPLILSEDGYLLQGSDSYTYYYSQTGITANGTITFNGVTEKIKGTSWIDRQYGNLSPQNGTKYEWFSLQLSNNMDINLWNIFAEGNKVPNNEKFRILSAYVDEDIQYTNSDFKLERLAFEYTEDKGRCYAKKWKLTSDVNKLDLIISTLYSDSEVQSPFQFYEGATKITGTVNGKDVTGYGFAELLHTYKNPELAITNQEYWNKKTPIEWQIINPDDALTLHFNIEYSTDNKATYQSLAKNISNTSYLWNKKFKKESSIWFKITASSNDSTLLGTTEKQLIYKK